jgi:hypothetical protein
MKHETHTMRAYYVITLSPCIKKRHFTPQTRNNEILSEWNATQVVLPHVNVLMSSLSNRCLNLLAVISQVQWAKSSLSGLIFGQMVRTFLVIFYILFYIILLLSQYISDYIASMVGRKWIMKCSWSNRNMPQCLEVTEEGHEIPHSKVDDVPTEIRNGGLPDKGLGLCPITSLLGDMLHTSHHSFWGLRLQRPVVFVLWFYDAVGILEYRRRWMNIW